MTPENIDNTICAEIPPPDDQLHELVVKMMICGPCSHGLNSRLSCVQDCACKRGFIKLFSDATLMTENSFPNSRMRSPKNGGFTAIKFIWGTPVVIENRWVVPYSPYLLKIPMLCEHSVLLDSCFD